MTISPVASSTSWRRLIVDAFTAIAALALAVAAVNGTADVLPQLMLTALLLASAALMEPKTAVVRRSERRARQYAQSSPTPA